MIRNTSNNRVIARKYKICDSFFSQMLGLMFSKRQVLLFVFGEEQEIPLHNWFVFFPINLVFLDKRKRIVEIKRDFKPFTFYTSKKNAKYLIETPYKINCAVGDKIKF